MVNSHANAVVLTLTVRIPNAQVIPSRGSSTKEATNRALHFIEHMHVCMRAPY